MQSKSKILVEIIVFENKHALSCYNNGAPKSFFPQTTYKKHWIFSMTNNNQEQTTPQNNTQPEESIGSKQNKCWQFLKWHVLSSRQLRLVRAMLLIWLKATERDYLRLAGRCIRKGRRLGQRLFWWRLFWWRLFWMTRTHFEWHERNRHDWRRAR